MNVLRGLGIQVDLDGNGDDELRAWVSELKEARVGAEKFAGTVNGMEREMVEAAKKIGLSRGQLKDLVEQTRHGAQVQDFANRYGFSMSEVGRQSRAAAGDVGRLGSVLQAVAAAGVMQRIGSFAADAVNLAAQYESSTVSFEVMLGSAQKARTVMQNLNQFSIETPFNPTEVMAAGRSLLAFGVQAENLTPMMRMVGDVASGVGMNFNELSQIMGKNLTQGKVQTEDLMQLAGRGVPIYAELAKVFNTTTDNIRNLASSGSIRFEHLQQAFQNMTSQGGRYFGMMDRQSRTALGLWSTLTGNVDEMKRSLGQMIMEGLRPLLELAVQVTGAIVGNETAVKVLKATMFVIVPVIGVLLVGAMKAAIVMAWNMAAAVLAATWPFALIAGAIMIVILIIQDLYTWITGGESIFGKWLGTFDSVRKKISNFFVGIFDGIKGVYQSVIGFFSRNGRYFVMAIFPISLLYYYWDEIKAFFMGIPDMVINFFAGIPDRLMSFVSGIGARIREALKGILPDWAINLIARVSGEQVQARAGGGDVEAGRTYIVGERGPEILQMGNRSGNIIPNGAIAGAGSTSGPVQITLSPIINFNAPVSRDDGDYIAGLVTRVMEEMAAQIAGVRAGLGMEVG